VDRAGRNAITVASGANLDAAAGMVPDAWLDAGTVLLLQNEVRPGGPLPAEDWGGLLDLLVVNESELASLAGSGDDASLVLARSLQTHVLATLGAKGAVLTEPGGTGWRIGALPLERVVDTTAAGDGFVGALAAALHEGFAMPDALRRASVAGGIACTRPGAQPSLATRAEIEGRLAELSPARAL
jgi:ribokinase